MAKNNYIKFSYYNRSFKSKPNGKEIAIISNSMEEHLCRKNNLKRLAKLIGSNGHSWCPAVFNGSRSKDNFVSAQLIGLDFDGGISFDEVLKRSEEYMIPILFAYETFSSVNRSKFRVVFLMEDAITDLNSFDMIISMLMQIFTECDPSCKDSSRLFFGGKGLLYYNDNKITVDYDTLKMNFELYCKDKYGCTHYQKKLKLFYNSVGKNSPSAIHNKIENGEKLPLSNTYQPSGSCSHKQYRKDTIIKLQGCCRLFNEFSSDSEWLYYDQLFGIATNLIQIETGSKTFLDIIEGSKYKSYKKPWDFYLKYYNKNSFNPMHCDRFCPYHDTCAHGDTMLSTAKVRHKEILRTMTQDYSTIEEVQDELKHCFLKAVNSDDDKIHVIKAQTAIGKTHMYLQYLKSADKPCIIAAPTNILKNEIFEECVNSGIDAVATPSIHEILDSLPRDIANAINYLYKTGQHRKVLRYIRLKANSEPLLQKFLEEHDAVKKATGHIITTHHRILFSDTEWLSRYNIIIDEDILKTMVKNQIEVDLSDIEELLRANLPSEVRAHLVYILNEAERRTMFSVSPISPCDIDAEFDLNSLLTAEKFYSDGNSVTFYQTPELHHIKYTVLSATADEYIYKRYFGADRIEFHTCKLARYRGDLIQHFDHSYSRAYIKSHKEIIEDIRQNTNVQNVITFKMYSDSNDIHFGNSEGVNSMKGQDLAVIGTPHIPNFLYEMLAYQIGYETTGKDIMRYIEVSHNGFRFWFYTYKNELLRQIQFWMIESELEQSVGRARLLREDCTVYLYSDYPLIQSELVKD